MSVDAELCDKIVDLEVKLAYQDHRLLALDQVVRTFSDKLASLERELEILRATVKPATTAGGSDTPPHY
jgi:uncharacterized coiled-coil protein SlyX